MDEPERKEEDTLSEAGKRKAAGVADTADARATEPEKPATIRLERPRRKRKNAPSSEDPVAIVEAPAANVEIREKADGTSITPLTGMAIDVATPDTDSAAPPSSVPTVSERIPLSNPQRWDRYEIVGLLGKGGMGTVFEARDKRIERRVALKFIHTVDPYMTSRFLQEARAQARMNHPNVCRVLEVGEVEGRVYIAMQLVHGEQLSQAAKNMSLDDKVRLMKTVSEAVHAAHRLGIIHRDIKPANIMVEKAENPDGTATLNPILMDFGLAREESSAQGLTESGALLGTPGYMSPEQARGQARGTDARTDVYGLGATLYDLLTGAPPFVDANAMNVVLKVLIDDPIPVRIKNPEVPQALDTIVIKCLAKEPHRRYASAAELADDLERFLSREKVLARRLSLPERLYWRGKRNKPMALAVISLVVSLVAFTGYGIDTAITNARREQIAQRRAELGKKLSGAVKDLDWLVRTAHLVPLHDTTAEKEVVRQRMAGIEAEMRSFADLGAGFDHYALGRGHLALEEWEQARTHFEAARARGIQEPELDYGLGRALGELYSRALEDARKSGDATYFAKRKGELDKEYLEPALVHLERCRGLPTVSANYLEGLIHFYHRRYEEALEQATLARSATPWLYEAAKLQGDVYLTQALEAKDKGENDLAERDFGQAVKYYEQAADVGRSDHQVYEALAEAWIRQEEMDLYRGRDPKAKLDKALVAADKALVASPKESSGYTKKAFAYYFGAKYAQDHGGAGNTVEQAFQAQIEAGRHAIALHPTDAYAQVVTGIGLTRQAEHRLVQGASEGDLLQQAIVHLEQALRLNPRFPWAYNDYGNALGLQGYSRKHRNEDPSELLSKAVEVTKKAVEMDEQYFMAYNNASAWLYELAGWQLEHGTNPEAAVEQAIQMADRAIQINKQHPLAYGNAGLASLIAVTYRRDVGLDARDAARIAIKRFADLLEIDPHVPIALRDLARAYLLLSSEDRVRHVDPRASLDEAMLVLDRCYRIDVASVPCKIVEAEANLERAKWAQERHEPWDDYFARARRLAEDAAEKQPHSEEGWLTLAEVCLEQIQARRSEQKAGDVGSAVVERGIQAIEKALDVAPGLPRALAIQGTLHFYKSRLDAADQQRELRRARECLSRAFADNSNLKFRFGATAGEVERLLRRD